MPEPYAVWLDRDVVEATGPDAGDYLQGQLSQEVLAMGDGSSVWSWVLSPQGKVEALVRLTRLAEEAWLLDTDAGWGEALLSRLNKYKLRTKVEFTSRPWKVVGLRGGEMGGWASESTVIVPAWPAMRGVDLLGPDVASPPGLPLLDPADYEAERIVAGMPKMGAELTEKTIPAETGLIDMTVSFSKGCYTGQELVARIDSRGGNVARHLRLLRAAEVFEAGSELSDGDQVVGTVTSAAPADDGAWVGLGYVRRGIAPPATVQAAAGQAASGQAASGQADTGDSRVEVEVTELRP